MIKKIITSVLVYLCCFINIGRAEICPTSAELKMNQFNQWQPIDIDNGTPISGNRLEQFKNDVGYLALAEWMADAPEGPGHCYYYGTSPDTDYLNVYLAKQHIKADLSDSGWRKVSADVMQCNPTASRCQFIYE